MESSEKIKKYLPIWQEKAKAGDGIAKYNLAICHINDKNDIQAYELLCDACKILEPQASNDKNAREVLGIAYFNRAMLSIYFDDAKSYVNELKKAIEFGYLRAYMYLAIAAGGVESINDQLLTSLKEHYPAGYKTLVGILLLSGIRGYEKDPQQGLSLLKEAAEMGEEVAADAVIQNLLKQFANSGEGDIDEIIHYTDHASNQWIAFTYVSAFSILIATGDKKDLDRAIDFLDKAVKDLGSTTAAAAMLGILGVQKDLGKDIDSEMLQQCADLLLAHPDVLKESSNAIAAQYLAACYEKGDLGLEQDLTKALRVYQYALSGYECQLKFYKTPAGKRFTSHWKYFNKRAILRSIKANKNRTEKKIKQLQNQLPS